MIPKRAHTDGIVLEPHDGEDGLNDLLKQNGDDDLPNRDSILGLCLVRFVDAVLLKDGPFARVDEVEEGGEDPVDEDGGDDRDVFVGEAGEDVVSGNVVDRVGEGGGSEDELGGATVHCWWEGRGGD